MDRKHAVVFIKSKSATIYDLWGPKLILSWSLLIIKYSVQNISDQNTYFCHNLSFNLGLTKLVIQFLLYKISLIWVIFSCIFILVMYNKLYHIVWILKWILKSYHMSHMICVIIRLYVTVIHMTLREILRRACQNNICFIQFLFEICVIGSLLLM